MTMQLSIAEPDANERLLRRMLEIGIGAARDEADRKENQRKNEREGEL